MKRYCDIKDVLTMLTKLSRLQSLTQKKIAEECGLSRVTIHRFFNGKSEMKASDFIQLLSVLGIEIMPLIERRLSTVNFGDERIKQTL